MTLITEDVAAFAAAVQGRGRLLSLDVGDRTIGMAVADDAWTFASPVRTLHRTKFTADTNELLQYADVERIVGFVIGLPLHMDGTGGKRVQSTRAFALNLSRRNDRPTLLHDERLSTFEAHERKPQAAAGGKRVDDLAATVILEDALRALRQASAD